MSEIMEKTQKKIGSFAALRGKMGNNVYYVVTMTVSSLLSIFQVTRMYMQPATPFRQQVHFGLSRDDLVTYLVNDQDRFFGSIIIQIRGYDLEAYWQRLPS